MCTYLSNDELSEIGVYMMCNGWDYFYDLENSWLMDDLTDKFISAELLSYWYKVKALIASSDKPRPAKLDWTTAQFETDDKMPSIDQISDHCARTVITVSLGETVITVRTVITIYKVITVHAQ